MIYFELNSHLNDLNPSLCALVILLYMAIVFFCYTVFCHWMKYFSMGGGNTPATSTVTSGATPSVVAPRHVQLPDIPVDNNVLFELLVFIYSTLVLGLQYINLYKTVWWLPHSSAHYGLVRCISHSSFKCACHDAFWEHLLWASGCTDGGPYPKLTSLVVYCLCLQCFDTVCWVANWVMWCWHGYICLGRGADLHMPQLMSLPLTISCSSKSRLVFPSWFYLFGASSPG